MVPTVRSIHGYFRKLSDTRLFLMLWSLLLLVHLGDTWDRPVAAGFAFCYFLTALLIKNEKWAWVGALVPLTLHLANNWPYNANHMAFVLVINLYLLTWCFRKGPINFKEISSFLFLALGSVYLIAAFHKINSDFLNPISSCANFVMDRFFSRIHFKPTFLENILPGVSLLMESVVGILMLVYRTRRWAIVGSLCFHFFLAWSNFVNFASLPLVFFMIYLLSSIDQSDHQKKDSLKVLAGWYIVAQVLAFSLGVFKIRVSEVYLSYFLSALVWTFAAGLFLVFLFKSKPPLLKPIFRRFYVLFLVPIFILGFKIYFGAGTSNSFSMFSNIRTEGNRWNHLLVPSESKVLSYQNDIYVVDKIDPNYQKTVRDFPTVGIGMPALEVYRLYDIWRETDPLPLVFDLHREGDFQSKSAYDLLPPDSSKFSKWEKKFFHFRAIQVAEGPNECRW